jgi:hypothetical protein
MALNGNRPHGLIPDRMIMVVVMINILHNYMRKEILN